MQKKGNHALPRSDGETRRHRRHTGLQGNGESIEVYHAAAGGVQEVRPLLHLADLRGADQPHGGGQVGDVQADEVGLREQQLEGVDLHGVPQGQLGDHIVVDDLAAAGAVGEAFIVQWLKRLKLLPQ